MSGEKSNYAAADANLLGFPEFYEWVAYDPETGIFTWKKDRSRRYKAGMRAGMPKTVRKTNGVTVKYTYIGLFRQQIPAQRVAWLLHYGEWPKASVQFRDEDITNLRIANLKEADYPPEKLVDTEGRIRYKMQPEQARRFGLKRYYGLTLETYNVMLEAQGGVCAICKGTETYQPRTYAGPKALSVDHNHDTGQIRGLLCSHCNYVVGFSRESRDILLAAVKYLDKHAGRESAKQTLTVVPVEEPA